MHELVYAAAPPNLPGLNRLAVKLNDMKGIGEIPDWHLGRWANDAKSQHAILFDSEADAVAAAKCDA
jgi:hypothetical protein